MIVSLTLHIKASCLVEQQATYRSKRTLLTPGVSEPLAGMGMGGRTACGTGFVSEAE
jgi:hypothetical protein